jgi:alpha-L-rhamnosidase
MKEAQRNFTAMSGKILRAKWITDGRFYGLPPINVFHKQLVKSEFTGHRTDLKNLHMLVRKEFILFDSHSSAYIDITADDYYKLFILLL